MIKYRQSINWRFMLRNGDLSFPTLFIILYLLFYILSLEPMRFVLGLLFTFYIPGAPFIRTLFPSDEIDKIERAILIITASVVITPAICLVLVYTSVGVNFLSILLSEAAFTLTFTFLAWKRMEGAF